MPFCGYYSSVRKLAVLLCCTLTFCGISLGLDPPPAPSLTQVPSKRGAAVVLLCQAPEGHRGLQFILFQFNVSRPVDRVELRTEEQEARFTRIGTDTAWQDMYYCQYQNSLRFYSISSPLLILSPGVAPLPSPILSVEPPSGRVQYGQILSFHCSMPPSSSKSSKPDAFLLLRTAGGSRGSLVAPATLVSRSPNALFTVGPVRGGEGGAYICLYQVTLSKGRSTNSTTSESVQVTVSDLLPMPSLSVSREEAVGLVCTGSPSYPGALFSLFRLDSLFPEGTLRAPATRHSARFSLPTQRDPQTQYQCQYSVLLGTDWAHSEHSPPVAVPSVTEMPSNHHAHTDWALAMGSVSAGLLFLAALIGLGISIHRKVRAVVENRRKREEAAFWNELHSRDHIADHTLQRLSFTSKEFGPLDRASDAESIYQNPLSTFANPPTC